MAEALLREAWGPGSAHVVSSAGVHAEVGRPPSEGAVHVMRRRGIDISGHASRPVTAAMLDASDLVVAMESQHVVEMVSQHPDVADRTFALRELVELIGDGQVVPPTVHGERWGPPGRSVRDHLGRTDWDVADPIGRSRAHYRRCADELAELCGAVAGWLAPPIS